MGESYVRPVTGAREPLPRWVPVWRFRLGALLVVALLAWTVVWGVQQVQGVNRQDPGVDNELEQDPAVDPSGVPAP
jgi:negative regulator of sigma E activity